MTDPLNLSKIDLANLNLNPTYLHMHFDNNVKSRFSFDIDKISWSNFFISKLSVNREDDTYIYTADRKYHYLIYTYLIIRLPEIKCKGKAEARWTYNVGLNIVKSAFLTFNNESSVQKLDDVWLNIYNQYFIPNNKRDLFNVDEGWKTYIPAITLTIPQPWYYSKDDTLALPLFLCKTNTFTHRYIFRNLSELLRIKVDGEEVSYSPDYIEQVTIPTPEMWGKYVFIDDNEIKFIVTNPSVYMVDDIVKLMDGDIYTTGQSINVDINTGSYPCKALFWVAEEETCRQRRIYSIYYSSNNDNPFKTAKIMYGPHERIAELPIQHYERIEAWYHYPGYPTTPGYNTISWSFQPASGKCDNSIIYNGAKLVLRLKDDLIGRYRIYVYALITKMLTFEEDKCVMD